MTRLAAEAFHPSEFIADELKARGWSLDDLATRMGGDFGIKRLALDFYMEVGPEEPGLRLGDCEDLGRAFGTSATYWTNLENAWLAHLDGKAVR